MFAGDVTGGVMPETKQITMLETFPAHYKFFKLIWVLEPESTQIFLTLISFNLHQTARGLFHPHFNLHKVFFIKVY